MSKLQKTFFLSTILLSFFFSIYVGLTFNDRGHYAGDGPSNDAAWNGGVNFNQFGFLQMRGVPVQTLNITKVPDIPANQHNTTFYFHYPAGPDLMQGVLFRLGLKSREAHQFFAILISCMAALFAWRVLSSLFSLWTALFTFAFLVLTPNFIFFADNLHGHAYLGLLHWFFIYRIYCIYFQIQSRKKINIVQNTFVFFLLGMVGSWFSLDLVPSFLILGLVCLFIVPKKMRWKEGLILTAAAPLGEISGFALHLYKNGLVLGGFKEAIIDFAEVFMVRTGHVVSGISQNDYNLTRHIAKFILGQQWFFTLPFLAMAIAGWYLALKKRPQGLWVGIFIASFIGAFFWQFFMKQHGMIHAFTYRHTEIFAVFGVGLFVEQFKNSKYLLIFASVFLVIHASLAVFQIEGTVLKKYFIHSLLKKDELSAWACVQIPRLKITTELQGAKEIVQEYSRKDCEFLQKEFGLRGHVAELILFWR